MSAKVEAEKSNPLYQGFDIRSVLNSIDIYGKQVNFTLGKDVKTVTNVFGGVMTILFIIAVLSDIIHEAVLTLSHNGVLTANDFINES